MELDRAKEIVSAINSFCFATMGLGGALQDKKLKDVSLMEMIEANEIVVDWNDRPPVNGKTSCMMHPDDRLIAAVYAFMNFPKNDPDRSDQDNVILSVERNGYVEFLGAGRRMATELDEEDEEPEDDESAVNAWKEREYA